MATYTFKTLDDPSATGGTFAQGINDSGQLVGYYVDNSGTHGFVDNGGTYTTFATVPQNRGQFTQSVTTVEGINNFGRIVGSGQYTALSGPPPAEVTEVSNNGFSADISGSPWQTIQAGRTA